MKPVVAFTVADKNNLPYYEMLKNSLRKFHSEKELPLVLYTEKDITEKGDYYKQKPLFASKLMDEYECAIGLDADQIILGDLSYIWTQKNYDIGTVLNTNREDPKKYGLVQGWGIPHNEYFNCGLVAMRSKQFVNHWLSICNSRYFPRFQYGEQDIMNILAHFGGYKVKCFDQYDKINNYYAWHGLVFKGEEMRAILKDGKVILPPDYQGYPDRPLEMKVWHTAGGGNEKKLNYRIKFNEELIKHIDTLVKP